MNAQPEALARANIKPGTKFYHGAGHHHFDDGQELHLPQKTVDRLVADGLLAAEPPPAAESAQDTTAEALPAPEAAPEPETAPAEGEHQA